MRLPRFRFTVRRMMVAVAIVGLLFAGVDAIRVHGRSLKYRRMSESAARRERRCRQIDAMDPATRTRETEGAFDEDWFFLIDPVANKLAIQDFANLRIRYEQAANHPRDPVLPDPQ